jgi:hypothetical protein
VRAEGELEVFQRVMGMWENCGFQDGGMTWRLVSLNDDLCFAVSALSEPFPGSGNVSPLMAEPRRNRKEMLSQDHGASGPTAKPHLNSPLPPKLEPRTTP